MADSAPTAYPWYTAVSGRALEQGDILLGCPVPLIPPQAILKPGEQAVTIDRQNVIVLTQSCDLRAGKVEDVILASVFLKSEMRNDPTFRKDASWEDARKGRFPAFHVLNQCKIPGHELDFMLVDLRRVFTLSIDTAREVADNRGKQRVRLLPPYREHLSQAFARFFMRVGLPIDIPKFK